MRHVGGGGELRRHAQPGAMPQAKGRTTELAGGASCPGGGLRLEWSGLCGVGSAVEVRVRSGVRRVGIPMSCSDSPTWRARMPPIPVARSDAEAQWQTYMSRDTYSIVYLRARVARGIVPATAPPND